MELKFSIVLHLYIGHGFLLQIWIGFTQIFYLKSEYLIQKLTAIFINLTNMYNVYILEVNSSTIKLKETYDLKLTVMQDCPYLVQFNLVFALDT